MLFYSYQSALSNSMYLGESKPLILPEPQFYNDCSSAVRYTGCAGPDLLQCMCYSSLKSGYEEINPYLFMAKFSCVHLFKQTLMRHVVASKVLLIARIIENSRLIYMYLMPSIYRTMLNSMERLDNFFSPVTNVNNKCWKYVITYIMHS